MTMKKEQDLDEGEDKVLKEEGHRHTNSFLCLGDDNEKRARPR
jgi:hypothetical protein